MSNIPLADRKTLLSSYDTFIFDADGVLWLISNPIPGASEVVNSLIDLGKQVIIVTNNPTKTLDEYVEKVHNLGFTKLKKENIVSSAIVMAHELVKRKKNDLPVYLIGTPGMKKTLEDAGIESFGVGPDQVENYTSEIFLTEVDISQKVSAVVVSYDNHFNYVKLMKATNYLKDQNVDFLVTEGDVIVPGPKPGVIMPCTSWIADAVESISGRKPLTIGKPNTPVFDYINAKFKIDPKRSLMTGDSTFSDIPFGNRHGFDTMLVLSGSHSLKDVEEAQISGNFDSVPKFYAPSIKILLENQENGLKSGA